MTNEDTTRYLDLRIELELLRDDFLGALDLGWRVQHQLLNAIGHSPPPSEEAWQNFVRANKGRMLQPGEWEVFDPFPNGVYCSRYHGFEISNALDEFKTLATKGFRILEALEDLLRSGADIPDGCQLDIPAAACEPGYEPSLGEYGWIEILYETGRYWPTISLRVEAELFWGDPDFESGDGLEVLAKRVTTPVDGSARYPTYPLVESLESDLFRSSAEAISLWLYPKDRWIGQLPVYLPLVEERNQQIPMIEVKEEEEGAADTPTSLESDTPVWDDISRTLSFHGKIIRRYTKEPAECQVGLLEQFQREGWLPRIKPPKELYDDDEFRLSQHVLHLNNSLLEELLHFTRHQRFVYWHEGPRSPKRPKQPPASEGNEGNLPT